MSKKRSIKTVAVIHNKLAANGVGLGVTGVLTIGDEGRSVYCPNPSLSSVSSFKIGTAYGPQAKANQMFRDNLQPLLAEVISGNPTLILFAGEGEARRYIFEALMQEFIKELFETLKGTTLRLSCCQVQTDQAEGISDLLKGQAQRQGASADPALLLREGGRNQGMTVPGLWEVQVKSVSDVLKVLERLYEHFGPNNPMSGPHHSLLTYSVEDENSQLTGGKVSFLIAGHLLGKKKGTSQSQLDIEAGWLQTFRNILQHLEACHPSPSFHRSRMSLLLRDCLCGRMACAAIGVLTVGIQFAPTAYVTLQLLERLNTLCGPTEEVLAESSSTSSSRLGSKNISRSRSSSQLVTPLQKKEPSKQRTSYDDQAPSLARVQLEASFQDIIPQASPRTAVPSYEAPSMQGRTLSLELANSEIPAMQQHMFDLSSPRMDILPSTPEESPRQELDTGTPYPRDSPPSPLAAVPLAPRRSPQLLMQTTQSGSPELENRFHQDRGPNEAIEKRVAAAMKEALDASARQVAALVQRLQEMEASLATVSEERDKLAEKFENEGGTLSQRDRLILQKARQDVKDYEVYKSVMEATISKLRDEMQGLKKERDEALQKVEKMNRTAQKHRSITFKNSKEIMELRQTTEEAQIAKSKALEEVKELQKMLVELRQENREAQLAAEFARLEIEEMKVGIQNLQQSVLDQQNMAGNADFYQTRPGTNQTRSPSENGIRSSIDTDGSISSRKQYLSTKLPVHCRTNSSGSTINNEMFTTNVVDGLKKNRQAKLSKENNLLDRADGALQMAHVLRQMK